MGTGGALRDARMFLGARFILTFGDVLRRFAYDRFVQQHMGNCLAVYPRLTTGNADVAEGFVVRFDKRAPELPYVDAGFSLMHASTIDILPETGSCSFEEVVYANLAEHGSLEAEIVDHEFFDIGTLDELAKTRKAFQ
jgi:NDP-sugar pyrophosphorylase family protein